MQKDFKSTRYRQGCHLQAEDRSGGSVKVYSNGGNDFYVVEDRPIPRPQILWYDRGCGSTPEGPMRKVMSIAFATFIAIGVIVLIAKGMLDRSTGAARTAAVATLEEKLEQLSDLVPEPAALSGAATALADPVVPIPSREALRARWKELFKTWTERRNDGRFQDEWKAFRKTVDQSRHEPLYLENLTAADWELLASFLEKNGDIQPLLAGLTQPGYPSFSDLEIVYYHLIYDFDRLLSGHMLLASHTEDRPAYYADIATILRFSARGAWAYPPESLLADMPVSIELTLAQGDFDETAWEQTLLALSDARQRKQFVDTCAKRVRWTIDWYDQMPRGSGFSLGEAPQLHVLMWGYRYGLTSKMNQDMVRFSDIMGDFLDLAPRPYFEIKPELERIVAEREILDYEDYGLFDRTPTEVYIGSLAHGEFWDRAYREGLLDQTALAISLARYRNRHGTLPNELGDLEEAVPLNSLTGETHQYERVGDEYSLWFDFPAEGGEQIVRLWPGRQLRLNTGDDVRDAVMNAEAADAEE